MIPASASEETATSTNCSKKNGLTRHDLQAPGENASATIDRFCSALHRRRRSGPGSTSTRLIALSLAPVQAILLASWQETALNSARARRPLSDGYRSTLFSGATKFAKRISALWWDGGANRRMGGSPAGHSPAPRPVNRAAAAAFREGALIASAANLRRRSVAARNLALLLRSSPSEDYFQSRRWLHSANARRLDLSPPISTVLITLSPSRNES
jgi:hypothetical protein